ncbi:MAG: flagellin FliC [Proteobacteria bacterium]|jgi:flagellin|nr:flagellin FliC [Pseudomonadota bacterium]
MGLRINTNVPAINGQRNLRGTNLDMQKAMQRLSSGYRINNAGDDAAGLAISENLKAQIRGFRMNQRNSEDGVSLVQVAEGGLNETSSILARMRELGIQAASDTIGDRERGFLDAEYQQLLQEIDRIANATEFNQTKLLNGSGKVYDIQVGIRNMDGIDRIVFDGTKADSTVNALGLSGQSLAGKKMAQQSLAMVDNAINKVASTRADFGALQNRLQSTINNLGVSVENLSSANSRIRDADIAVESAELARNNIMLNAGTAVLQQANQTTGLALKLINQ